MSETKYCCLLKVKIFDPLQNFRRATLLHDRTPTSGLYKSLQNLTLDHMIKLTLIRIAHSYHQKTQPKSFDNLFKYLKTAHSYYTRNRSNQKDQFSIKA